MLQMINCEVSIHSFQTLNHKASKAVVSAALCEAVHRAALDSGVVFSEPIMRLDISCDTVYTGTVYSHIIFIITISLCTFIILHSQISVSFTVS